MDSLDPRIKRLSLPEGTIISSEHEHWETYEVFHQHKRGEQPVHVGIVHAPSPEIALIFAKEQFGRRQQSSNIWVVRTTDVFTFNTHDEDMFETTPEKKYREASGYSVREKINQFKKENKK